MSDRATNHCSDLLFPAALALLAMLTLVPQPGRAETLKAHYALSLIGISFGSAFATGAIEPDKYRIDIAMKTTGLANLINDTKGAATASGKLAAGGPDPASFANSLANSTETRTIRMSLSGHGVRGLEVNPPPWDAALRIPVSAEQKHNVLDPVSALIMSVPPGESLVGPAACNRVIPVFDGVTRFDVRLTYVESRTARTKGYEGPVTVCSARYTPISGHSPQSASTKFMAENKDMTVWLAPLPEAHVVAPLRIDIRTSAGMMSIDAVEFHITRQGVAAGK